MGLAPRIPSLDGLRGIAILMVLIAHSEKGLPSLYAPIFQFAGNGVLGVSIFFVLSGFLIYNLSIHEIENTGSFNWRQFYLRRALRIFPCFYLYIAALLGLMSVGVVALSWQMIVSAATFSLNYRHVWDHTGAGYNYEVIGHYWTLALEEQFYLTWPFLIVLFKKGKLIPVLWAIMILSPLIRAACYFAAPDSRGQIGMMFHTSFDFIAAGVLLGELLRKAPSKNRIESLASRQWIVWSALFFLVFISPVLTARFGGQYALTVGRFVELILLWIVIAAAVSFPQTLLFRLLNWRPLAYVGILSYSLYVWNNLFLLGGGQWYNNFPCNFLGVIVMALLSHYCVEKPFIRLKTIFNKS